MTFYDPRPAAWLHTHNFTENIHVKMYFHWWLSSCQEIVHFQMGHLRWVRERRGEGLDENQKSLPHLSSSVLMH